jgi:hypothetical protein
MAGVRTYTFVTGVETPSLPSSTDPTVDADYVNKGYADKNYGAPGVNRTGSKASPTDITAGGGITPIANRRMQIMFIQGSGGAVDITANPQIVAGSQEGDILILVGCSDTNTVTFDHGTGLDLNGQRVLGANHMLMLMWLATGTVWAEMFYGERT